MVSAPGSPDRAFSAPTSQAEKRAPGNVWKGGGANQFRKLGFLGMGEQVEDTSAGLGTAYQVVAEYWGSRSSRSLPPLLCQVAARLTAVVVLQLPPF